MKKVTAANGGDILYFQALTIMYNFLMNNGTYPEVGYITICCINIKKKQPTYIS